MELWVRRLFWLAALVIGAGGTLIFVFLFITKGPPPSVEALVYVWPCSMIAVATIAIGGVRRAWRESPADLRGLLQWRLSDLLISSLLIGVLMTTLSKLRPKSVPTFDIPVSMICGFGFAVGLLIAARMGLTGWKTRYLYAVGFSLRILGLMAMAVILVFYLLGAFGGAPLAARFADVLEDGLGLPENPSVSVIMLTCFVMPFALFALGHAFCCVAARRASWHEG